VAFAQKQYYIAGLSAYQQYIELGANSREDLSNWALIIFLVNLQGNNSMKKILQVKNL